MSALKAGYKLIGVKDPRPIKGKQMSEEENVSVETQSQEVAQSTETEIAEQKGAPSQEIKRRNDAEFNWAELRKKTEQLEKKTREQDEFIQRITQPKQPVEDDDLDKLGQDDIITVKQARKIADQRARQVAEQVMKERDASTVDERLGNKFADFNEVVSRENIENLKEIEPELAKSLSYITDPYDQGVAAYKLMKRLGINVDMAKAEKEKAIKNSQKPVSVNAVTKTSAIGNAHLFENGLTPELKRTLFKEMEESRKRA